jgi:hypothetical protein
MDPIKQYSTFHAQSTLIITPKYRLKYSASNAFVSVKSMSNWYKNNHLANKLLPELSIKEKGLRINLNKLSKNAAQL